MNPASRRGHTNANRCHCNVDIDHGTLTSNHCHCNSDNDVIQDDDSVQQESYRESNSYEYDPPPAVEEKMRRELKFFFMNPYEKYKARGRKPWKLGVQLVKILLVTLQVITLNKYMLKVRYSIGIWLCRLDISFCHNKNKVFGLTLK